MRKIFTLSQFIGLLFIALSFIFLNNFDESKVEIVSDVAFLNKPNEIETYKDNDEREETSRYVDIKYDGKIYKKVKLFSSKIDTGNNFYLYKNNIYASLERLKIENSLFVPIMCIGWITLFFFSILKLKDKGDKL